MSTALAEKTNTFFHAGHRSAGTDEAGGVTVPARLAFARTVSRYYNAQKDCAATRKKADVSDSERCREHLPGRFVRRKRQE